MRSEREEDAWVSSGENSYFSKAYDPEFNLIGAWSEAGDWR